MPNHHLKEIHQLGLLKFLPIEITKEREINYYSFSGRKNIFNINEMEFFIQNTLNAKLPSSLKKFEIISSDSWLSHNTSTNETTNQLYWFREFKLPQDFLLEKDSFRLFVNWKAEFPYRDKTISKFHNGTFKLIE